MLDLHSPVQRGMILYMYKLHIITASLHYSITAAQQQPTSATVQQRSSAATLQLYKAAAHQIITFAAQQRLNTPHCNTEAQKLSSAGAKHYRSMDRAAQHNSSTSTQQLRRAAVIIRNLTAVQKNTIAALSRTAAEQRCIGTSSS